MNYKFSFSIPTYNAQEYLARCLASIRMQNYPRDEIEILIADGGSRDRTIEIAKSFGAKVFHNPRRLADYGAKINAQNATGDLFVIFAADNELGSDDWLKTVAGIFEENREVVAVWGRIISGEDDPPLNRYYELIQNDPFTNFMNRNLEFYIKNAEMKTTDGRDYFVFSVERNKPLIWGANGLVYRLESVKDIILQDRFLGDNDVFQMMIEREVGRVAYMPSLRIYHHHVKSIRHWVSKWKRNFTKHVLDKKEERNMNWMFTEDFRKKLIPWSIYSLIPVFSLADTAYKIIRHKNPYWIYHPLACFAQSATYMYLVVFTKPGRKMLLNILTRT